MNAASSWHCKRDRRIEQAHVDPLPLPGALLVEQPHHRGEGQHQRRARIDKGGRGGRRLVTAPGLRDNAGQRLGSADPGRGARHTAHPARSRCPPRRQSTG